MSEYLTVQEVADRTRCREADVHRAIGRGDLSAVRGCASVLVRAEAIDDWMDAFAYVPGEHRRVPEGDYVAILRHDPCCYCGASTEHIDHIQARERGGIHVWTNLTAACARCNGVKHARPLLTFLLARSGT